MLLPRQVPPNALPLVCLLHDVLLVVLLVECHGVWHVVLLGALFLVLVDAVLVDVLSAGLLHEPHGLLLGVLLVALHVEWLGLWRVVLLGAQFLFLVDVVLVDVISVGLLDELHGLPLEL